MGDRCDSSEGSSYRSSGVEDRGLEKLPLEVPPSKNRLSAVPPALLPWPLPFAFADGSAFLKKLKMLAFGFPLSFPLVAIGLEFVRPVTLGKVLVLPNKGTVELGIMKKLSVDFTASRPLMDDGGVGGRPVEGV